MAEVGDTGLALGVLARHPPLEAAVESTPSVTSNLRQRHIIQFKSEYLRSFISAWFPQFSNSFINSTWNNNVVSE